jgi:hypothetical protein
VPIRSFVETGAFGPEAISAMSEALEAAPKELQGGAEPDVVREPIPTRNLPLQDSESVIPLACWKPRSARESLH